MRLLLIGLLLSCGGSKHNGYRSAKSKPWLKPKKLTFDDIYEIDVEGKVSFPNRKRSAWYKIELPTSGTLKVRALAPFGDSDMNDIGIELYNGNYELLTSDPEITLDSEAGNDNDEEEEGSDEDEDDTVESRTIEQSGLPAGTLLVHVYARKRKTTADFSLSVKLKKGVGASSTSSEVALLGALPLVPVVDDTPKKKVVRKEKRREKKSERKTIRSSILRAESRGKNKTKIIIKVGSKHGVTSSWSGKVVSAGKTIPGGRFRVSKVTETQTHATVSAPRNAVIRAKRVVLSGPKK